MLQSHSRYLVVVTVERPVPATPLARTKITVVAKVDIPRRAST